MSSCAVLTYNNISLNAWETIKIAVQQYAMVQINDDSGSYTSQGFTIQWQYDSNAQIFYIQCTDSPFFAPCSMINARINDAVESALHAHGIQLSPFAQG